jgi:uncharacterized protein YeaO (DUF488 family)
MQLMKLDSAFYASFEQRLTEEMNEKPALKEGKMKKKFMTMNLIITTITTNTKTTNLSLRTI